MRPGTRPATSIASSPDLGRSPDACHAGIPPRCWRAFPGHPDQVARARHFVARALADCPAVTDVVLLTSELATNAVQHSASGRGGIFAVAISHAPGRVRVTVTDGGSASLPVMAAADELSTSGRGLILVDCLALRWGYTGPAELARAEGAPAQATVWFELTCR
ncbi:MAG TPA: ATP-binding protein [Streptosporangiaceae bacterium]|nr:ATP-binding protein [Streptosporangiaceae bacterium]